jgi:hypothetical protein
MTVATTSAKACAHGVVMLSSERREDGASAWWACRDCGVQFAPIGGARVVPSAALERPSRDGMADPEYVSIRELSRRIPYAEGSIRNLMSRGALKLGEHYVKPQGRVMSGGEPSEPGSRPASGGAHNGELLRQAGSVLPGLPLAGREVPGGHTSHGYAQQTASPSVGGHARSMERSRPARSTIAATSRRAES